MHKLVKPSGVEVEVNDRGLKAALALGWTKAKAKKKNKKAE